MDPLTVISLVSNILSFVDAGSKVLSGAIEIYKSPDPSGLTEEARSTEVVVEEMRRLCSKLQPPNDAQLPEEKALCVLAKECNSIAQRINVLVNKMKLGTRRTFVGSLVSSGKWLFYKSEIMELQAKLDHCRGQLNLELKFVARPLFTSPLVAQLQLFPEPC